MMSFDVIFERLAPESRDVLAAARVEAIEAGNNFVGTEHLLLGLLNEDDSVVKQLFVALGVDPARISQDARAVLVPRHASQELSTNPPLTPHVALVLQLSAAEADQQRAVAIEPRHLVLGLIAARRGVAHDIFSSSTISLERARDYVANLR
jgi:ATP-dependent Clp protease ATP-binding subunit ClpC